MVLFAFFSRQLFHLPNGFVVVGAGLFFGWLLMGLEFSSVNWPAFILAVLVISLSSCAAGGLLSNLTTVTYNWILLYRIFAGLVMVLSGVIIPVSSLPAPLAAFSQVLPLTHGLAAFRGAFDGAGLSELLPSLAGELAVGLVYAGLGLAGYHVTELVAKRRGVVETIV